MLQDKGFKIIDADVISREVLVKHPEILDKIRIDFGEAFLIGEGI